MSQVSVVPACGRPLDETVIARAVGESSDPSGALRTAQLAVGALEDDVTVLVVRVL